MHLGIRFELEADGQWIAEVPALPGVLGNGATRELAHRYVSDPLKALSLTGFSLSRGEKERAFRNRMPEPFSTGLWAKPKISGTRRLRRFKARLLDRVEAG
ncbi:MAG: type II toxin-antitoxin system HicB family antitoxin [Limisphaerales bacterium]